MLAMIQSVLELPGNNKSKILLGIFLNLLRGSASGTLVMAVFMVMNRIDSLTAQVIVHALLVLAGGVFVRFLCQWLLDRCIIAQGYRIFRDYRLSIGDRIRSAPMGYFSKQKLGSIQTVLTTSVYELEELAIPAVADIAGGVLTSVVMVVLFFFFEPVFAWVTIAGLAVSILVLYLIGKTAPHRTKTVMAAQETMTTQVLESIRGIGVMRTLPGPGDNKDPVYRSFDRLREARMNQELASIPFQKIYTAVYKLTGCALMFTAVVLYIGGDITLAYCLMFIISGFLLDSEIGSAAQTAHKIISASNRLETVTNMPKIDTTTQGLNPGNFDIALRDISFGYDDRTVIDHVSLEIAQGSSCAFVGPSGSGKTTLCNLIARFWDVRDGQVLIGGEDVRNYTGDSLMRYISMVFQNVFLFNDTIEHNIRFGNPGATYEQMVAAAKRAQCHGFIQKLPGGYSTVVGEGGSALSGGEKQRISIARAILKDAPIVILDEATSSLDPENEYELISAIRELTRGKTLISIAHRIATVEDADKIIVLDAGRVVQEGTHSALRRENGIYRKFVEIRQKAEGWKIGINQPC